MSSILKQDILRATPKWRGKGARYDCVLINGVDGPQFAKVYILFLLSIASNTYRIAFVRHYDSIGRHPSSNYIRLQESNVGFVLVDTILRGVHILPPSTLNSFYTAQDLSGPDIHLRLKDVP